MSIHLFSTGAVSLSKAHKETGDVGARLKDKIVITGDIKARLNGDHGHWSDLFHLDCFALTRLFVVPFCRGNPVGSSRSFLVTAARDSSTSTPVLQPGSSSDPVLQQGASSDPVLQLGRCQLCFTLAILIPIIFMADSLEHATGLEKQELLSKVAGNRNL
ncbi:uncharacterized protein LOC143027551 isoform X2 [Oratosquilla oratoria]